MLIYLRAKKHIDEKLGGIFFYKDGNNNWQRKDMREPAPEPPRQGGAQGGLNPPNPVFDPSTSAAGSGAQGAERPFGRGAASRPSARRAPRAKDCLHSLYQATSGRWGAGCRSSCCHRPCCCCFAGATQCVKTRRWPYGGRGAASLPRRDCRGRGLGYSEATRTSTRHPTRPVATHGAATVVAGVRRAVRRAKGRSKGRSSCGGGERERRKGGFNG